MAKPTCQLAEKHTPAPTGYLAWHEWAEKKAKTHRQVLCDGCGRYKIWVRGDADEPNRTQAQEDNDAG